MTEHAPGFPASSAAMAVLSDRSLFSHIAQFERGVPLVIHDLVSRHRTSGSLHPFERIHCLWLSTMELGDLRAVQLLHRMRSRLECAHVDGLMQNDLPSVAVRFGRIDVLEWFHATNAEPAPWPPSLMAKAAATSDPVVAIWLLTNRPDACEKDIIPAFISAAERGQLQLLRQLIAFRPHALTSQTMDTALIHRQWEVIHYLHENSQVACTTAAMDEVASRGYLDVVTFLHENRTEGCTTNAMNMAAWRGHLDVVKFLHHNRTEGCTKVAMDYAASLGHLDIVRFLHDNRTEGCTEEAMARAARNGLLDVVKFLHEHRGLRPPAGFAVRSVFPRGTIELVKYLHEVVGIPFDNSALSNAKAARDKELISYVTNCMRSRVLGAPLQQ